ncbi:MAG: 2-hydroxy-3-oxopropionate reductase [Gammaproteobacteria bacterium]|nr:2-hydroxy-3-oxopropionate reductase [Gammaproteobacteria bacterium]MDX2488127.1 2-hydroxy-3-oxopropionate reductase [Gammaproteobacteria bacterium]
MEKIAYIGLGIMGRPMVLNLLQAGYSVRVWARRSEMMEPLVEAGATACSSPADAADNSDIIITNVSDTTDVEQVVLGQNGIIEGAAKGSVVVDMSTISPSVTRAIAERLGERSIEMLDAPVSGGEKGAIDGTLSIMVGGKAAVFERVLPVFDVLGSNIVHIGDIGAGQVTKACNQTVIAQSISAIGEAFVLAAAAGVDPAKVREALLGGFAGSKVLDSHGGRMLMHDFKPGFKARLHQKDMRIVLETAHELGIALPGASLATQLINALVGSGGGEDDSCAILRLQEQLSGVDVSKKPGD